MSGCARAVRCSEKQAARGNKNFRQLFTLRSHRSLQPSLDTHTIFASLSTCSLRRCTAANMAPSTLSVSVVRLLVSGTSWKRRKSKNNSWSNVLMPINFLIANSISRTSLSCFLLERLRKTDSGGVMRIERALSLRVYVPSANTSCTSLCAVCTGRNKNWSSPSRFQSFLWWRSKCRLRLLARSIMMSSCDPCGFSCRQCAQTMWLYSARIMGCSTSNSMLLRTPCLSLLATALRDLAEAALLAEVVDDDVDVDQLDSLEADRPAPMLPLTAVSSSVCSEEADRGSARGRFSPAWRSPPSLSSSPSSSLTGARSGCSASPPPSS